MAVWRGRQLLLLIGLPHTSRRSGPPSGPCGMGGQFWRLSARPSSRRVSSPMQRHWHGLRRLLQRGAASRIRCWRSSALWPLLLPQPKVLYRAAALRAAVVAAVGQEARCVFGMIRCRRFWDHDRWVALKAVTAAGLHQLWRPLASMRWVSPSVG